MPVEHLISIVKLTDYHCMLLRSGVVDCMDSRRFNIIVVDHEHCTPDSRREMVDYDDQPVSLLQSIAFLSTNLELQSSTMMSQSHTASPAPRRTMRDIVVGPKESCLTQHHRHMHFLLTYTLHCLTMAMFLSSLVFSASTPLLNHLLHSL